MDIAIQLPKQSESDFILALINHERWAQKQLYESNYSCLLAIAMRYAGNNEDAFDILHESFIKIFNNIHKYKIDTSFTAWIKRILINTAIDFYRKEIKRKVEDLDQAYYLSTDIPDAVSKMSSEEIMQAMQQLPPSYRSVFNLFVIEGYSHRDISKMLGINESTCRSNLVKARARLKTILLALDSGLR
ncbi:MAG: RNA polymerase sigma factor [Saprospiraceae bacterium]|nr:MAG: ECF subfamily RNA polymerase sigma-24 subunit [Bacteroidetes bacterium OLB9]MCO6463156.1 RNA polymerase sigma factor [Saprospiraceae bacterium]MCZ2337933.1 RNA polymerase sigma factor [Chitinophagales bacterium]